MEQERMVTMGRKKRKGLCEALIIKTNSPNTVYFSVLMKYTASTDITYLCWHPFNSFIHPFPCHILTPYWFWTPLLRGHWSHKCCPLSKLHVSLKPLFWGKLLAISLLCQMSSQCVCQRLSSYTTWHLTVKATSMSKTSPNSLSTAALYNNILGF